MGIGSFICLVGAVFQTAAQNVNYLIGGRVVLGLGAVIAQTAGLDVFIQPIIEINQTAFRRSGICRRDGSSCLSRNIDRSVCTLPVIFSETN